MRRNEGNIFSGGTQTIGQVVAGRNARAHMEIHGAETTDPANTRDLCRQLDELIRVLQEHHAALPDGEYLVGDARRVAAELARPEPNKGKISSLLQVLEDGTKSLASVATIVGSIKTVAIGLLGL